MFKAMSTALYNHSFSAIKAETFIDEYVAQNNLLMSLADELPNLFQKMCPDSGIAKGLCCDLRKQQH